MEIRNNNSLKEQNKQIYELIGRITGKVKKKPSLETIQKAQEKGTKLDEYFYKLDIICENKPEKKKIYIFKNTCETEKIWKDVESSEYIDRRYLFYCQLGMYGAYRVVNWKELKGNGKEN